MPLSVSADGAVVGAVVEVPPYQTYAQRIAALVSDHYDPRHVEAFMRLEFPVLDWMDEGRFGREVAFACACIDEGGYEQAERLARSYGL